MSDPLDNGESDLETELHEKAPIVTPSIADFSEEEQRLIDINATAYARALQMHEDNKNAQAALLSQQAALNTVVPEPIEPYHQRYFFTRMIPILFVPVCVTILVVLISVLVQAALARAASNQIGNASIISLLLYIVCAWWLVRESVKALLSSIYVDEDVFRPIEPRVLWLGLIGSKAAYDTNDISVTNYYASFWNFIPGWNSWVLELDTPAQRDQKLEILKYVKYGDAIVEIVSPSAEQTRKNPFKRR